LGLARRLGCGPAAAALGAIVYGLSGFTLSSLNLYIHLEALAWAPLVISLLMAAAGGGGGGARPAPPAAAPGPPHTPPPPARARGAGGGVRLRALGLTRAEGARAFRRGRAAGPRARRPAARGARVSRLRQPARPGLPDRGVARALGPPRGARPDARRGRLRR